MLGRVLGKFGVLEGVLARALLLFLSKETPSRSPLASTPSSTPNLPSIAIVLTPYIRSFEKGLADRGGWREEILHMPEIGASFLYPFSYAPLGEGGHISGELF